MHGSRSFQTLVVFTILPEIYFMVQKAAGEAQRVSV